jgi:hypothetical protein
MLSDPLARRREQLERQLQLSRHSQQLFKAWTDTLLTGITDRPLGAAYLNKVIQSDLAALQELTDRELAIVPPEERKDAAAEVERLKQIRQEFQHTLDQLGEVDQLRSRSRPDVAWQRLIDLPRGIDQKLNDLIRSVSPRNTEVIRTMPAPPSLRPVERCQPCRARRAHAALVCCCCTARFRLRTLAQHRQCRRRSLPPHRVSGRDEFDLGRSFTAAEDLQAHRRPCRRPCQP